MAIDIITAACLRFLVTAALALSIAQPPAHLGAYEGRPVAESGAEYFDIAANARTEIGEGGYVYRLENGSLSVYDTTDFEIWRSDSGWIVHDFRLGDVVGDGAQDFLFTLWKPQKFVADANGPPDDIAAGPSSETPSDGVALRNHLYLYTIIYEHVKPVWCSSALPRPVYSFELDPGGRATTVSSGMLLHTDEGLYRDDFSFTETRNFTYVWESWGFIQIN